MALLEHIFYQPQRAEVKNRSIQWVSEESGPSIRGLPQIFWKNGDPWSEVNLWALELSRSSEVKLKTIVSLMEHLHKYARWLENEQYDWRHFPKNKSERVLVRYRGALIKSRDMGELSPSTTTARMRAVIRFYRYCESSNFVSPDAPKWQNKIVHISYFDSVGFERTMQRITTNISIPNRSRPGPTLEDGLLPISSQHMLDLLSFTETDVSKELHLMLLMGFFTGARLCTITSLRLKSLDQAVRDPMVTNMWVIPVGPGTGVDTKFDISGDLLVPDELMRKLKSYAYSDRHISRVIKAAQHNKSFLFLTRQGKPFRSSAVHREMVELRRNAIKVGLKFMNKFKFHQTRATFGTWLMSVAIKVTDVKTAIEFLKRAMHHKRESTTFRYITFIEHTKAKIDVANAFTEAFLGIRDRFKKTGDQ